MTRTKVLKRRQQQRLQAEREEMLRLAQIKIEASLDTIDELEKSCKQQVDNEMQSIMARVSNQVLQMKWSEFLKLQLNHFSDFQFRASAPATSVKTRSQSISQGRRGRTPQQQQLPRKQVQSVDRAVVLKKGDDLKQLPTLAFMRWPHPGEKALSLKGSPLAVQALPDHSANVNIPTKGGVLTVKPLKLGEVKREVLRHLDEDSLNQLKTLSSNLTLIVKMANKMGK